jgi:subtilisin family serine protease
MSLGGMLATRAEKLAIEAAEAAGVIVVAASGNDGKKRVSFPAAFPTVLSVGAVDSKSVKADFSNWGPELDVVAPGVGVNSSVPRGTGKETVVKVTTHGQTQLVESTGFAGSPDVEQPLELEVVYCKLGKTEDFNGLNLAGKYALIQRGEISFADKAKNAIAAGARGVIIYNNVPGLIQGAVTQDGSLLVIPVVMIKQDVGEALRDLAKNGARPTVSVQTMKTDYASFDGTSMATPHVSGVAALMKAANPRAFPARVREVIKATATPLSPNDDNQVGHGLVNAQAAVEAIVK